MIQTNIKNLNKERGFTIVELLIVIVVIGILATITIVAYNGVQNRARTTTNQSNANEVRNKSEVYAADTGNGAFPTAAQLEGVATTDASSLSPKVKLLLDSSTPAAAATAPTSGTSTIVSYAQCPATGTPTGAKVGYWDHVAGAARYLASGTASTDPLTATC
jgi:prepilin-type N-terminal cleavage/methylation domain-containing protein